MQSAFVLNLTRLATLGQAAAMARAVSSRLLLRYPCFMAMTAMSLFLLIVGFNGEAHPYTEYWYALRWPQAVLSAAAGVEAFWLLARHFRGIRNFGWWLIVVILLISGAAAASIGLVRVTWNSPLRGPVLAGEYLAFAMLITVLVSRAFFRQFPQYPIRPNAKRHAALLALIFASDLVGWAIGSLSGGHWTWAGSSVLAAGGNLAFWSWTLLMTPAGEQLPFEPPPSMSDQEFDDAERRHKRSVERIKRAGRGWWRAFGW